MSIVHESIRGRVQELFQTCAYLDIQLVDAGLPALDEWQICVRVTCGGAEYTSVLFMATNRLASMSAEGFTGCSPEERFDPADMVRELANVMAGHAHEIFHQGRKPEGLSLPEVLSAEDASALWRLAPPNGRFEIRDEVSTLGGLCFDWSH